MKPQTAALFATALAISLISTPRVGWTEESANLVVADGLNVSIEYSLELPDKTKIASNIGQEPVSYVQGEHQIVPGLEKALTGMKAGETKKVEVASADAYGAYDDKAKLTVERNQVPDDVEAGTLLSGPDGRPVKVLEVSKDSIVIDMNHPLAGKDLVFDVKVLKVEKVETPPAAATEPSEQPGKGD